MSLNVRSRIEEIRSRIATRGILGQGIAAGGGIAPGGFKVFGQQEGTILDTVRARAEEIRKRIAEIRPGLLPTPTPTPSPTPTSSPTPSGYTPPSSPAPSPAGPVTTYTAKIKTY